jgi:hypothetical protein
MTGAAKGRKGPEPGTVRRYDAADRALFPELEQTMREKNLTRTAAALHLAHGKVAGPATLETKGKRLATLHKRERSDFTGR